MIWRRISLPPPNTTPQRPVCNSIICLGESTADLEMRPDIRGALAQATIRAMNNLTQYGDGPITGHYNGFMTPGFNWYMTPPATNFQVYAQSSKGVLTWGVLVAALTGLGQYVNNTFDYGDDPIVFQINDGGGGEVGIGYVGFIDPNDPEERCIYQLVWGMDGKCEDVTAGKVIN